VVQPCVGDLEQRDRRMSTDRLACAPLRQLTVDPLDPAHSSAGSRGSHSFPEFPEPSVVLEEFGEHLRDELGITFLCEILGLPDGNRANILKVSFDLGSAGV
jgi:hypothetical protein